MEVATGGSFSAVIKVRGRSGRLFFLVTKPYAEQADALARAEERMGAIAADAEVLDLDVMPTGSLPAYALEMV